VKKITCKKCEASCNKNAKFCQECGEALDSIKEKFKIEPEKQIHVGKIVENVAEARLSKIGLVILVTTFVLILVLNQLPVAKATNNEEQYTAYYDSYLEKLDGSDPKAPRELIEDNELEDVYLKRLEQSQIGLMIMVLFGITLILYGNFYEPSQKTDYILKNLLRKTAVCILCFLLYGAVTMIGLAIEKYVEEGVAILPLVSIYYVIYGILILKFVGEINRNKRQNSTTERLDVIFETTIYSIMAIPMLPWLCAIFIQSDNGEGLIYNEISILAAGQSEFTVYELTLLAKNLEKILLLLWTIAFMAIIGEIGLNLSDDEGKSFTSDFLILMSNAITLLAIGIMYFHFMFFLNVEKFELYINEVVNNGDTNINYLFIPNYGPLLFSISTLYQSIKFNSLTFEESYSRVSKKM
jgi:hypothetical protein